jgi:hypothetical protein
MRHQTMNIWNQWVLPKDPVHPFAAQEAKAEQHAANTRYMERQAAMEERNMMEVKSYIRGIKGLPQARTRCFRVTWVIRSHKREHTDPEVARVVTHSTTCWSLCLFLLVLLHCASSSYACAWNLLLNEVSCSSKLTLALILRKR